MKSKAFINLLTLTFFITFSVTLFAPFSTMANEPIRGTQLALQGISADDADAAVNDELSANTEPRASESTKNDSPKSLEQELIELKQEVQRIRSENEARKRLEVPEEEKGKSVEDILSAAGRQYTLLKKGTVGLSYTFGYAYYSGEVISVSDVTTVERRSNHNLINTINAEYAIWDNLSISTGIPFVYKYNRVGTSDSQDATDLGDISVSFQAQPFKSGGNIPTTIFSAGVNFPTGSSPYKVDPAKTLPTGAGLYSFNAGLSLSKVLDPLVAFGNLNYSYSLPEEGLSQKWGKTNVLTKVDPGSSIGLALGFGYSLSYQASLNLSAQFNYTFSNKYTLNNGAVSESGDSVSSSFNVGTGWRITPTRAIYAGLGIGLTNNDPDLSFSIRLPFEFKI